MNKGHVMKQRKLNFTGRQCVSELYHQKGKGAGLFIQLLSDIGQGCSCEGMVQEMGGVSYSSLVAHCWRN